MSEVYVISVFKATLLGGVMLVVRVIHVVNVIKNSLSNILFK